MTYSSEVLADSPSAYYRLGDASGTTMTDSSGNSRNGTYVNSPTLGATGLLVGDADTAVSFDASNDRGETTYASWMDSSTALTVEAWIRPNTHSSGVWRPIVDRDKSGGRTFIFGILNDKVRFIKTGGTGGEVQADSTTTLTQNGTVTYHVVATYDGSNIRIYINGTLEVTQAASGNIGTGNSPFLVGASYLGTSSPAAIFGGTIDEAAIYNTVLSGTRVSAHYTAGTTSALTVSLDRFTASATMRDVLATTFIEVAVDRFTAAATMLDVAIPNVTDVGNELDGRLRSGSGTVTITRPVTAPPASLVLAEAYDKAMPYPTPTMVDGRPT